MKFNHPGPKIHFSFVMGFPLFPQGYSFTLQLMFPGALIAASLNELVALNEFGSMDS